MSEPVFQNHDVDDDPAPDVISRARAILDELDAHCTGFVGPDCPCRELALRLARMEQMEKTNDEMRRDDTRGW